MRRARWKTMAWVAVALLAVYAVPTRIAGIMAGDHPTASSAARG